MSLHRKDSINLRLCYVVFMSHDHVSEDEVGFVWWVHVTRPSSDSLTPLHARACYLNRYMRCPSSDLMGLALLENCDTTLYRHTLSSTQGVYKDKQQYKVIFKFYCVPSYLIQDKDDYSSSQKLLSPHQNHVYQLFQHCNSSNHHQRYNLTSDPTLPLIPSFYLLHRSFIASDQPLLCPRILPPPLYSTGTRPAHIL